MSPLPQEGQASRAQVDQSLAAVPPADRRRAASHRGALHQGVVHQALLHRTVLRWYAEHARPLPWREAGATAWGVFVSEVMSQQTPVARVEPIWREWMSRWPTPGDLAAAPVEQVLRAWGRLGYPRRALRLREAASAIAHEHAGMVPRTVEQLLELPGVGAYTAAAVACFAYGVPVAVVDTNVRRVLARAVQGKAQAAPALTVAESRLAAEVLPDDAAEAATWNVAVMELGALVCTARAPRCEQCPIAHARACAWVDAGRPEDAGPPRRGQSWAGTDRQVRGALVQALREVPSAASIGLEALAAQIDRDLGRAVERAQLMRCLDSLVADGLVEPLPHNAFRLPA